MAKPWLSRAVFGFKLTRLRAGFCLLGFFTLVTFRLPCIRFPLKVLAQYHSLPVRPHF